MRRAITLLIMFAVGGCSTGSLRPPDQAPPAALSAKWLVGGWVPSGESCQSDAGIVYRPDGRWQAYEETGSWRVEGNGIVFTLGAARHVETVEMVGPDEYLARREDGTTHRLVRCRQGSK